MGGLSGNVSTAVDLLLCQDHEPGGHPLFNTLQTSYYSTLQAQLQAVFEILFSMQVPISLIYSRLTVKICVPRRVL